MKPSTSKPVVSSQPVEITERGIVTHVHVPDHDTDHIQKHIFSTRSFYELEMLRFASAHLSPGDLVIDAGAYIGNHTLYFANVCAADVVAFEPNAAAFKVLESNVQTNGLADKVTLHMLGLGTAHGSADLEEQGDDNVGMARLVPSAGGAVRVESLDDIDLPGKPALIKIDVEGMECDVLRGAEKTIRDAKPLLYVECATEPALVDVVGLLSSWGYAPTAQFSWTPTLLFRPSDNELGWLHRQLGMNHWREQLQLQGLRRRIAATAELTGQLGEQVAALSARIAEMSDASRAQHDEQLSEQQVVGRRLAELTNRVDAARDDLRKLLEFNPAPIRSAVDRLQRKYRKLRRDPEQFFSDSRGAGIAGIFRRPKKDGRDH